MRQVFFAPHFSDDLSFESLDALPVSETLLKELLIRFKPKNTGEDLRIELPAAEALAFLRDFYARFELSQPQRRIWARFEKEIAGFASDRFVSFVAADVSAHRSRRKAQKIQ